MTEWNIETAINHHAGCSIYDDGACTCGFRKEALERSPLAPGEGTWSVFAQKAVKERDLALEEVARLKDQRDVALEALETLFRECKSATNIRTSSIDSRQLVLAIELPINLSNKIRAAIAKAKGEGP